LRSQAAQLLLLWGLALLVPGTATALENQRKAAAPAPKAGASAAAAREGEAELPARGSEEDCRNWWHEYMYSQGCFNRFRNAGGGIKPEGYRVCGREVLDPSPECGPPRRP
jgi:hypothetical protein